MQIGLTSGSVDRSYADAFRSLAGDLQGVRDRIDYLRELGVTYLHLMPLLAPRDDPTMAGTPSPTTAPWDPRLGDMDDLRQLAAALREHGISPFRRVAHRRLTFADPMCVRCGPSRAVNAPDG